MENYQKFIETITGSPDLPIDFSIISQFTWSFSLTKAGIFKASGHVDCHHRGVYVPDKAVMVALQLQINGAWLEGSKTGCNIVGSEDHYAILPVVGAIELPAGDYEVTLWMRSASTADPNRNGIAEVKADGYNRVFYEAFEL